MAIEHTINSFSPNLLSQAGQCICEAGILLFSIPGQFRQFASGVFVFQVPQPNSRVDPETHCCRPFGALSFEALYLLATEQLFCVLERILDRPSAAETANHLFWFHFEVGGDEKIVGPFAAGISSDDHHQWLFAYVIPDDRFAEDQHGSLVLAFGNNNSFPLLYGLSQQWWFWQDYSSYASSTSPGFCFWFWQVEYDRILSHVRYDFHVFGFLADQSGVKTVAVANKLSIGQPGFDLAEHLQSQFDMAGTILEPQPHVDRQANRFAAPGRFDSQSNHHQVETPRKGCKQIRKHRVSPFGCSLDMFAGPAEKSVVYIEIDCAGRTECLDQQQSKSLPKKGQVPAGIVEETVKGIVRPRKKTGGKWHNAGNSASGRAQNPATDKCGKNIGSWSCKNAKKVIDNVLPSRCNNLCMHTDLHVLMCFPLKTSVGQYARAQFSSALAA